MPYKSMPKANKTLNSKKQSQHKQYSHLQAFLENRKNQASYEPKKVTDNALDLQWHENTPKSILESNRNLGQGCQFMLIRQGNKVTCSIPIYKNNLCQRHYLYIMKLEIRKQLSFIYKDPATCYASFDFSGKGFITWEDIKDHFTI